MTEQFKSDLFRIAEAFYLEKAETQGYSAAELLKSCGDLPEILQSFYMTVGKDINLLRSRQISFYAPEQLMPHTYKNTNPGIVFARIGLETGIYVTGLADYWTKETYDQIKTWSSSQQSYGQGSFRKPPYSEFLFWSLCNAQYHAANMLAVDDKKVLAHYQEICASEFGAHSLDSYIPRIAADGSVDEDIMVSTEEHLLIRICSWAKNKIIIASNDSAVLTAIAETYSSRWLKQNGKKRIDTKYLCAGMPQMSYAETLQAIHRLCFGKKIKSVPDEEFDRAEFALNVKLPSAVRAFYACFGNQKKMLDSVFCIPKLKDLSLQERKFVFAEDSQHAVTYLIDADDAAVYSRKGDSAEKLGVSAEDLCLYLIGCQCSGFMKSVGIIQRNAELNPYFIWIPAYSGEICLNEKLKMLGIPYHDQAVMMMSNASDAFEALEEEFDLPVEYLDYT